MCYKPETQQVRGRLHRPSYRQYRAIPLEVLVEVIQLPTYITLEKAGRWQPVLPFSAYGAVAMARPEAPNGGSSQFSFPV